MSAPDDISVDAKVRFATALTSMPEYPHFIRTLRDGAFRLFEATDPSDADGLKEARMALMAVSSLEGLVAAWKTPKPAPRAADGDAD